MSMPREPKISCAALARPSREHEVVRLQHQRRHLRIGDHHRGNLTQPEVHQRHVTTRQVRHGAVQEDTADDEEDG
jgi:hypothetical protein